MYRNIITQYRTLCKQNICIPGIYLYHIKFYRISAYKTYLLIYKRRRLKIFLLSSHSLIILSPQNATNVNLIYTFRYIQVVSDESLYMNLFDLPIKSLNTPHPRLLKTKRRTVILLQCHSIINKLSFIMSINANAHEAIVNKLGNNF